jgi:hypothetical protein
LAWTVRLDPFAIQDELRDGTLAHVADKLLSGARAVLDIDLGISDLVFFEEFFGFAAIAAPRSGVKQKSHDPSYCLVLELEEMPSLCSAVAEECAEQLPAFIREDAAGDQHLVIEAGVIQDFQNRADCT